MTRTELWASDFCRGGDVFQALALLPIDFGAWSSWPSAEDYNTWAAAAQVRTLSGHAVTFVPARPKPRGRRRRQASSLRPYEQRIWETGEVSTRFGRWHDFFNMLAWCLFPKTKAALNARQVAYPPGPRTPEQDLLCMFDEGGLIEVRRDPTSGVLAQIPFGHALQEAVILGQRGSPGMPIAVHCPAWNGWNLTSLREVDAAMAVAILTQKVTRG